MKTILGALAVLIALIAVYFFVRRDAYTPTDTETVSRGLETLRAVKPDDVARIELKKGKGVVELKKEGGDWVVASSHGYPADGERIEKLLKTLDAIEGGEQHGTSVESHPDFEVDEKKGGFIKLFGKDGKELANVVVGKTATGGAALTTTRVFARFGNEPITFRIESDLRSDANLWGKDAEGKSYLKKDLVKLPSDEVEIISMRITRPEKPDLLVERKYREVPVEKPKDATAAAEGEEKKEEEKKEEGKPEEKPETKQVEYFVVTSGAETVEVSKSEEWTARSFVQSGSPLSADDAAEPKELSAYGLDKPQLKTTFSYRKKKKVHGADGKDTWQPDLEGEVKEMAVLFGNEKKDDKGETQGYYVLVDGPEHKARIYTIAKYTVERFQKEMKDFLPKPKEEEKKDGAPPAAVPVPAPALPGGETAPPPAGALPPPAGSPAVPAVPPSEPPATTPTPGQPAPPGGAPPAPAPTPAPGSQPGASAGTPGAAPAPPPAPPPREKP
jgi:hypothetical protein